MTPALAVPVTRYVPPLPIDDVERRVIRACKTIRALPDPDAAFLYASVTIQLPIVHDEWFAFEIDSEERPRFMPKPFDVSDVLVALGWCNNLERRDFKIVWWRSFDWSFRQMGFRLGRSGRRAQQIYSDVMLKVWQEAQA